MQALAGGTVGAVGIVLHGQKILTPDLSLGKEGYTPVGVKVLFLTGVLEGLHVPADGVIPGGPLRQTDEYPIPAVRREPDWKTSLLTVHPKHQAGLPGTRGRFQLQIGDAVLSHRVGAVGTSTPCQVPVFSGLRLLEGPVGIQRIILTHDPPPCRKSVPVGEADSDPRGGESVSRQE